MEKSAAFAPDIATGPPERVRAAPPKFVMVKVLLMDPLVRSVEPKSV